MSIRTHTLTPTPSNTSFPSTGKRKCSDSTPGSRPPKGRKFQDPASSSSIQHPTFTPSGNQFVQTDLGLDDLKELEELRTKNSELSQSRYNSQKVIPEIDREIVLQGRIEKCYVEMKELLLEKCRQEVEQADGIGLGNKNMLGKGVHIELHKVLDMQEMRFTAIHTQKISMTGGRFKTIIKSKRLL